MLVYHHSGDSCAAPRSVKSFAALTLFRPSPPPGHPYQHTLVGGREGAGTDAKNARTRIFERTLKPKLR